MIGTLAKTYLPKDRESNKGMTYGKMERIRWVGGTD